ncbi:sulfotransferase [Nocardioides taihuensis]|uniref:Sulfotransferase n=1 Tax=Nocardioides taihuensis TaxID=1835606 RepID=A0ABW0BLK9_9ACTN
MVHAETVTGTPREGGASEAAVDVVFVGGMPRSGSTLLDLLIGQLPGHCDVGELFYLWQGGVKRDQRCSCGALFSECDFWIRVGEHAFGGWDRVDVDEVLRLQAQVDSTARQLVGPLARLSRRRRERTERYLELTRAVYRAVAAVSGAGIVVDSTKRPSTAALLARDPGVRLRIVHMVRDPRGVLNSWSREVPLPENSGPRSHLKKRPARQILRRWWSVNLMIDRLGRRGVPLLRLRYEDMVSDPREAMRAVMRLSGREATDEDLAFIGPDGVDRAVSHTPTGGRVRFSTGPMPLRLDEKWRTELPASRQRLTVLACGPLMRRYGYR